jgi:myo-inositol-1-phosphate synthase
MEKVGVVVVGINGAVSTTMLAGVELMARGLCPRLGMVTEKSTARIGETLPDLLDFVPLDHLVFAGWDLRFSDAYEAALHHRALPPQLLHEVEGTLRAQKPWPAVFSRPYVENAAGTNFVDVGSHREEIERIKHDVETFRRAQGLKRVVMVNLASTERFLEVSPVHQSRAAFERGLDRSDAAISPAMRYFYAANQLGIPYCNFTPTLTNVPALAEHAAECRTPFAGMDGKTGQTLVKTALAAMLRVRRLHVDGWYSTNILGNNDGLVLDSPGSNKTKVMSKASVLDSVLGYHVENHQVHIHYYKPRGDSKEAWDTIDLVGFAGVPMQMKIDFLCQDSALAAPLVLDLVRLLDVAQRGGERGVQPHLAMFFKSPFPAPGEDPVHDLFAQEEMLMDWARGLSTRLRADRKQNNGVQANGSAAQ